MKKRETPAAQKPPVDPDRVKKEFPDVSDVELHAYMTITQDIMTADNRAAVLRAVLERGRTAQDRTKRGEALDDNETMASNYLAAIGKMQRSSNSRSTH